MAQSQLTPSLLGTWRLLSFEARDSKGQLQFPLGKHVSGLLVYDAYGNMAAHVMKNDRPLFAANDLIAAPMLKSEWRSRVTHHISAPTRLIRRRKL
jgi:hypothetical protein